MPQYNTNQWNAGGGSGSPTDTSAQQVIYWAFRLLQVLRTGQTASPEAMDDGLFALNALVDGWNSERLMSYGAVRNVYDLTPGVQEYTLGPGGSLDGPRPEQLLRASLLWGDGGTQIEYKITPLTLDQWASIPSKDINTSIPGVLYTDGAYPLTTLYVWPGPNQAAQLVLYTWQVFQGFSTFEDTVSLPPGYLNALQWNLAAHLAPAMLVHTKGRQQLLGSIEEKARMFKAQVKSLNLPILDIKPAPMFRTGNGWWDINSGNWITR